MKSCHRPTYIRISAIVPLPVVIPLVTHSYVCRTVHNFQNALPQVRPQANIKTRNMFFFSFLCHSNLQVQCILRKFVQALVSWIRSLNFGFVSWYHHGLIDPPISIKVHLLKNKKKFIFTVKLWYVLHKRKEKCRKLDSLRSRVQYGCFGWEKTKRNFSLHGCMENI